MRWKQITLIVVGLVAILAVVALLMRPAKIGLRQAASPAPSANLSDARTVAGCLGSAGPLVPRDFLDNKHVVAMALVYQKRFDAGVPALRNIAVADPGFPGINFDISDALLQSHQAQQAKSAINSQIAISDCLVELPDSALQSYCQMELAQSSKDSCRAQLAQMQRGAHFQAALIDMAIANTIQPAPTVEVASNTPAPRPPPPLPDAGGPRIMPTPKPTPKPAPPLARPIAAAVPAAPIAVARPEPASPRPIAVASVAPPKPASAVAPDAPTSLPASTSPLPRPHVAVVSAPPPPTPVVSSAPALRPTQNALAPSQSAETATGSLGASEASQHVGETRTVCGPVADKHTAAGANGSPTFVELDRAYPNQIFTVLIWGSEKQAVGELPSTGRVCVTGKITTYAGLPEIVLHKAKDWTVSTGTPSP